MSTGLNFAPTPAQFGKSSAPAASDKPKAEFWINLGYTSEHLDDKGEPYFISLPQGIPLDTQEQLPTNSRNDQFAAFSAARNDLHDQLLAHAANLQPGEATTVKLEVQIRRVNAPAAPIDPTNNPMVRKIAF